MRYKIFGGGGGGDGCGVFDWRGGAGPAIRCWRKGRRVNAVNTFFFIYGYYIRMRRQIGNGWTRWGS